MGLQHVGHFIVRVKEWLALSAAFPAGETQGVPSTHSDLQDSLYTLSTGSERTGVPT